jgi:hypothetical protein
MSFEIFQKIEKGIIDLDEVDVKFCFLDFNRVVQSV